MDPKNKVIIIEDIKTANNDKLKEEQNIYDFLRGKSIKKEEINQMLTKEDENIELQKSYQHLHKAYYCYYYLIN